MSERNRQRLCDLCGGRRFDPVHRACRDRQHGRPGTFDVVRCRTCGLMQTDPRPDPRAIRHYYPPTYVPYTLGAAPGPSWRQTVRAAAWAPFRLRYGAGDAWPRPRPGAQRALDIGCGSGLLLARLARLGWDPWGIEPDAGAAAAAARRLGPPPDRVYRGPAEDAVYPAGSFGLVTLIHTLEHLHEPLAVLTGVRRWLRPGGELRVRVPNSGSAEARLFGRLWDGLDVPRHLYHFTPRTLTLLLERAGFTVQRCVPEPQAASLAGSLIAVLEATGGRHAALRRSRALYLCATPIAAILAALGEGGSIDVMATPHP
jgi:SAM-dependent methyltransferase